MPSKDPINARANEWMKSSDLGRPDATISAEPGQTGSRTERREMSGQVQRLARRLGADPDEIARRIPADTLRRTKYPVIETVNEDGTRAFKHDPMIEEGRRALVR